MAMIDIKIDTDQTVEINILDHHIEVDLSMDKRIEKGLSIFKIIEEILEKHKIVEVKILEADIEIYLGTIILIEV